MVLSFRPIVIALAATAAVSGSALAADASSSSAACPPPDAKGQVAYIKNLAWVRHPSGDDVTKLYPPFALRGHKNDRTVVDCAVADDGSLTDCSVVEDKKPGLGFDKAALSLAKLYKAPPLAEQPAFTGLPECIRKLGAPHVVIPMDWFAGG